MMTLRLDEPGVSPTLAINEAVKRRLAAGEDIVHLGFGEAGLPVHPLLREALGAASAEGGYEEVAGSPALREAVAGYYRRRGLDTELWQIIVGPGSKALLFALMLSLEGDVVLPRPAWVSYAAQARLARKRIVWVPIPAEAGGLPDPERIRGLVSGARDLGNDPRILLITQPDNPTGTLARRSLLQAVVAEADECGLQVISDEIYADLVHPGTKFTSAATISESCVLTGGLSKSLAIGGWRLGVVRLPATPAGRALGERFRAIASEIWSCIPAPIAAAAQLAYAEPTPIVEHIDLSRRLHAQVSAAIHGAFREAGAACRPPTAGFYLYPDLDDWRDELVELGVESGVALARLLLEQHGIAVLPGDAFDDPPEALRFRVATSLLSGQTDSERWGALAAAADGEAASLPAVETAVKRLREALESLRSS